MEIYNNITQRTYDPEKCVFFENALQSGAYVFRGNAELLGIIESKQHEGKFVFIFSKDDHRRLKQAWNEHRL